MPAPVAILFAILGAVMCFLLLMSLMAHEFTRNFFLIYLLVGLVIYFAYGMWNSKLAKGVVVTGHEPNLDLGITGQQPDPVKER
jgi:APA family basic amino acid/polyamine antiporter